MNCSQIFLINAVLEWDDGLRPSWVVPRDDFHRVNFSKLYDVQNLELLQLEESVEYAVVELTEESQRVSAGKVLLLGIIDGHIDVQVWLLVCSHWIWHSGQMFMVWCTNELLLELSELAGFVQSLGSVWVQVTQVVEVF